MAQKSEKYLDGTSVYCTSELQVSGLYTLCCARRAMHGTWLTRKYDVITPAGQSPGRSAHGAMRMPADIMVTW